MPPPGHTFDAEHRQSAAPGWAHACVRFETRGLAIERDGATMAYWPYRSIATQVPVPPKVGARIIVTSTAEPGATLTVDDFQFLASLLQSAPHPTHKPLRGPD